MTILVTGANGQLGNHMRLCSARSRHRYLFTDVDDLDITDPDAIKGFVAQHRVDVIVNCAAYTDVNRAEGEEAVADKVNNLAVGYLAQAMAASAGLLVHVSTDYVFGGNLNNTPCTELEKENPTGAYGRTKLRGERAIAASGCRCILLRTGWLYSEYGNNFCKTMLGLTATRRSLNVVFDQVGTPTYAGDLAQAIATILENGLAEGNEGLYHYSNEGVCSWYDFAKVIARMSGQMECDIQPCHSSEYPTPVVRPSYSVLDKTKFKQTFGIRIPYWTESLERCIQNIKKSEK